VVDVSTQARPSEQGNVYMMVLEVAAGEQSGAMKSALQAVAAEIGVDVDLHVLDDAVL